jgi:Zn-dependent M28 family amino/carboxypeptidase
LAVGCDLDKAKREKTDIPPPLRQAPLFNADSAYTYVKEQVEFGPRVPGTAPHAACARYLAQYFQSLGAQVIEQSFRADRWDGTPMPATNIIASFKPGLTKKRILLAAHWDTRYIADQDKDGKQGPIDGANDGASGVAVLMEVARQIALHRDSLQVGVDIILFDVEDQGVPEGNPEERRPNTWCLGSQHWAANKHVPNYVAYYGILLDMVGAKEARFAKEGTSMRFAPQVVEKIWSIAHRIGYGSYFTSIKAPEITDDHLYVNTIAKIPMIDIIEFSHGGPVYFGPYWHTHRDNIELIDPATLKAVGQVVLTALYNE